MKNPSKKKFPRSNPQKDTSEPDMMEQLDNSLQTGLDIAHAVDSFKELQSKNMEKITILEEKRSFLLFMLGLSWYLLNKTSELELDLDSKSEDEKLMEPVVKAHVFSYLWSLCQDLRTLLQKNPPDTDWFLHGFQNFDSKGICGLIILENLSEIWSPSEFATIKTNFKESDPENSKNKVPLSLNMFTLFQGDVKTFFVNTLGQETPSPENITLLSQHLMNYGLLRSAQACLESIPTPKFCEENEEWHKTYNSLLRYTGQHEKALALRWKYFQKVKTTEAVDFYLMPLGEQFNPLVMEHKFEALAQYNEHIAKIKQAIISDFAFEDAIGLSLELWLKSPDYDDLLDDLMLHYYNHGQLSNGTAYVLERLVEELENLFDDDDDEEPVLTTLIAYRALIQKKWRNKDQMSAQKSQEFRRLIDQAQAKDTELIRNPTTQHIPSHKKFIKNLKAKHSQTSSSSPRPTLSL